MATRALAAPVGEILMAFETTELLDELLRDEALVGVLLADDKPNEDEVLRDEALREETVNDDALSDDTADERLLVALLTLDAALELLLPPPPPPPPQATNKLQVAAAIVGVTKCFNDINLWWKKSCDKKE